MRISPISNFNYSKNYKNKTVSNPSFTSIEREIWQDKETGKIVKTGMIYDRLNIRGLDLINRNNSYIFRGDFGWEWFTGEIIEQFKDEPKVNMYCFGCSDGSEPYSIISMLKTYYKEDADKFFPIKCYDIDEDVIEIAKNGKLKLLENCVSNIKDALGVHAHDCFDFRERKIGKYCTSCYTKVNDSIKENAEFSVGNFVDELDNVEKKNSIVFCRNFWPYLTEEERDKAIEKLSKLEKGSIVCLGDFDGTTDVSCELQENGYTYLMTNVFIKEE